MDSNQKVLVVEDDGLLQNVFYGKLKTLGFDVLKVSDGKKALDMIIAERPAVVLLDLMVPTMDGFQVLEHVRNYPDKQIADIKVIVLSNLYTAKDILSAKALKIEEYYVKTTADLDDICARVVTCIRG